MKQNLHELIKSFFNAVEAKDVDAVMAFFHADAEFLDPHYPNVHMKGKDQIYKGVTWGLNGVKSFNFSEMNYFENKNGSSASIEYDTHLELKNGQKLHYQQVFIIETKDGKISRCQAYETYGPHGMHKVMLMVTRLIHRFGKG
jgi:ketosteroid isomerase-like protein